MTDATEHRAADEPIPYEDRGGWETPDDETPDATQDRAAKEARLVSCRKCRFVYAEHQLKKGLCDDCRSEKKNA